MIYWYHVDFCDYLIYNLPGISINGFIRNYKLGSAGFCLFQSNVSVRDMFTLVSPERGGCNILWKDVGDKNLKTWEA